VDLHLADLIPGQHLVVTLLAAANRELAEKLSQPTLPFCIGKPSEQM